MSIFSICMIGIGLSMDAFAVSIAKGMTLSKQQLLRYTFLLAICFGFFQALMPLLGWWMGSYFQNIIASFDHWLAFSLLTFIGIHMIKEANEDDHEDSSSLSIRTIIILAVATSIDALAVGISFAFLRVDILHAILYIGCITFFLCFLAVPIGHRLGNLLQRYAGLFGGILLILIGTKILIEHLFFM